MALYSAGVSVSGVNTAGKVYAALQAGATRRLRVLRATIAMPVVCTTVPQFQLRRTTAAPVTPNQTITPQALDPSDAAASASLFGATFATDPTPSSTPMDVASMPLTAGAAWVFNFATPLEIANGVTNGLAIYNAAASGATLGTFMISFLYDE